MKQPVLDLPGEQWKVVEGFPSYRISSHGRIASFRLKRPYLKRFVIDKRGYCRVTLTETPGNPQTRYIHILVAKAFLPAKPSPLHEIDHSDGNASNNHHENLAWVTHKDNIHRAMARRGNWLAAIPKRTGAPVVQILPDCYRIHHLSLSHACKHLSLPQTCSPNILRAIASGRTAYGFQWSR